MQSVLEDCLGILLSGDYAAGRGDVSPQIHYADLLPVVPQDVSRDALRPAIEELARDILTNLMIISVKIVEMILDIIARAATWITSIAVIE